MTRELVGSPIPCSRSTLKGGSMNYQYIILWRELKEIEWKVFGKNLYPSFAAASAKIVAVHAIFPMKEFETARVMPRGEL